MGYTECGRSRANQDIPSFACNPDLNHAALTLNGRPRETFGWKIPAETFDALLAQ
jgi:IS30 family transposase